MTRTAWIPAIVSVIALTAVSTGCSSNKEKIDPAKGRAAAQPSQTGQQAPAMPPGHPAVQQQSVANPHPATDTANGLTWDVPGSFEKVPPASSMRVAQYRIPSGQNGVKDGELAVFFFGAGTGGATQANLERWASQFQQAEQGDPMKNAKTNTFNDRDLKVTTIELDGRYVSSTMGGGPSYDEPNWRLLGAVVEGTGGPWFFKAVGPKDVLEKHRGDIMKFYKSFRLE
jgi:hypothetical protein